MDKPLKVEFPGSQGHMLAARLDLPKASPKAFALFAHCFTCSKDIFAATRIARALTLQGIAVLRFDFTGLGASEGEFANTNFSSNIEDLVHAADFLKDNYQAPQLLIGHSLGGAAVLAAADRIPGARAVSTIGAPADPEHVLANFCSHIDNIKARGEAEVQLAGRSFRIKSHFLEDISTHNLDEKISGLKKALLIFHSPVDQIVGIDNATKIFVAAKHPKSFVSLDKADHLLSSRKDAVYVADVLAAWASRYLEFQTEEQTGLETVQAPVRVEETGKSKFQQKVIAGKHLLLADEPVKVGGTDSGPSPYDYLSIALGACTTMTLRMYAAHKGYDIGKISCDVYHDKVHGEDCADCGEGKSGRIDRFERVISVAGEVPEDIRKSLVRIAGRCPVHKTLEQSSAVVTRMADQE